MAVASSKPGPMRSICMNGKPALHPPRVAPRLRRPLRFCQGIVACGRRRGGKLDGSDPTACEAEFRPRQRRPSMVYQLGWQTQHQHDGDQQDAGKQDQAIL